MSILLRPLKRKRSEIEVHDEHSTRIFHCYSDRPNRSSTAFRQSMPASEVSTAQEKWRFSPQVEQVDGLGSEVNSNRASPVRVGSPLQVQRTFDRNASVALVGIRGTGKSSLAVILAATSGRRLVDADRYFERATGHSRAAFKREHGLSNYRQQEAKIMESMLVEHREGCVIACGPGFMERSGQKLLREYAKTHPVVHVIRDPESIQEYLQAWDTHKVRRLLELSGPIYRACSNLEFFNVSERGAADVLGTGGHHHSQLELELDQRAQISTPFMTLKRLQRDFLRFVGFATGDSTSIGSNQHASFPLSTIAVESRSFTYAISVPISSLLARNMDIEDLECTVDAFELKLDVPQFPSSLGADSIPADGISQAVATIRRNIVVPLIYHVESIVMTEATTTSSVLQNRESHRRSDDTYLDLVQHGLRLVPEFLTVDLGYDDKLLLQIIDSKGPTKIIGHFATREPLTDGWDNSDYVTMYERAKTLGCDMVRLSQPATTMEDNFAIQRFRHHIRSLSGPHPSLVAYNSGPLGRLSCCFNPTLTPVTHPSLLFQETDERLRPCITAAEAQNALYTSFTLDPMQYFVFGANVTYSLSPAMHNAAYRLYRMPHEYRIHQSSTLRGLSELVENPHFGGTSLGLPYKMEVIPLLRSMSTHAKIIGAVNTLVPIRDPDGDINVSRCSSLYLEKSRAGPIKALHGCNTDWIGIGNCFRRGLSPANSVRPSTTGLVIGAGGMARAAVYAMIHLGVQNIFIYNRTVANAQKLALHYHGQTLSSIGNELHTRPAIHVLDSLQDAWPVDYKQPTVIASCIPAHSIHGQPAPRFELPLKWIESPTGGVVVELAYKPLNTPLIKQMRALSHRGWVALDGLDVLPEQGFAQFELFTGRRAPRRLMRTIVLKEYKEEEGSYDQTAIQNRLESLDGQPT